MIKANPRSCISIYIFDFLVWYNSGIKFGGKHLFSKGWYLNGVTTVGDFLNVNGTIPSRQDFVERFYLPYINNAIK